MKKTYIKRKQTKRRRKTRKLRGGMFNGLKQMFSSGQSTNETAKAAENAKAAEAKAAEVKAAAEAKAAANANPSTVTTNAPTEKSWLNKLLGR